MNLLLIGLPFLTLFLYQISCTFTSSCYLKEPSDIKSFEIGTLKYFNSAQEILTCGKKFKNSSKNFDSEYEKCVFALDIHQNYKTGLFSFTSKDFSTEYNFKEALEVGAFNFCNSFVISPYSKSIAKTVTVYGGKGFDFHAKVEGEYGNGGGSQDSEIKTVQTVKTKSSYSKTVETKSSDYKAKASGLALAALIFVVIVILYLVVKQILLANKPVAPPADQTTINNQNCNHSPYNLNQSVSTFNEAPPSYEEVNRSFQSYSEDKRSTQITKNDNFEKY